MLDSGRVRNGILSFAVFALGMVAPVTALGQFQAPTDEELKMTSDPRAPGAAAVYLYREETEDDPSHFRSVYVRIKVLTEKGKELATVRIGYQRNFSFNSSASNRDGEDNANSWDVSAGHFEVAAVSGRTIHADGKVVPLTVAPTDLLAAQKGMQQQNEMVFNLPSVEVGSILEYRYQLRYDRFQIAPLWQIQQPYFVRKAHYLFTPYAIFLPTTLTGVGRTTNFLRGPHDQVLTDLLHSSRLPAGKEVRQDPLGRYYLDMTDVPAIPQEAFAPPMESQLYRVDFYYTYTFVKKDFWQKEMQFWNKELSQYTAPTGAIKEAVSGIVDATDSELVKAKKLYAAVQKLENTDVLSRSFVENDLIPQGSVDMVLRRKSGSGKEIAFLYLALARAAGLNARAERIADRRGHMFSADYLSSSQLDCDVILVTIGGKEIFLDPGEKMAPFQTLLWSHAGTGGVALAADGKVETIMTPLQTYTDNTVVRIGKLTVSAQGIVTGTLKVGFTGQDALRWRQTGLRAGTDGLRAQLESAIARQVPDGIAAHVDRVAGLEDTNVQLVATVQVSGSLAAKTGDRLILPRMFFESKESVPFSADEARVLPVDMRFAEQEQEQITYTFPNGYVLDGTPADAKFSWGNQASYQLKSKVDVSAETGSVTSARVLARGFTLLGADEYGKLREFYQKVTTADHQQLVLNLARAGSGASGR